MPLVVNTNVSSINAQRNLSTNTLGLSKAYERLASGFRINRSSDDAAGLQISESLRSQIRGSKKALDNAQDGISVLNIVDGAQGVIQDNLQRIRELTVQAANDTNTASQRTAIDSEITARVADINRVANSTKFNGQALLDGTVTTFNLQIGAGSDATNDVISIAGGSGAINDSTATGLGLTFTSGTSVASGTAARTFLDNVDTALSTLNTRRANVGSLTNRLESASQNLSVSVENLSAAESRIRNVDVAAESSELSRYQILQQSANTILAQANQAPQLALSLLRGG
jgi:flagellin